MGEVIIKVVKVEPNEMTVAVSAEIVIARGDIQEFEREIKKVIEKYEL